jgi:hypothetical protein
VLGILELWKLLSIAHARWLIAAATATDCLAHLHPGKAQGDSFGVFKCHGNSMCLWSQQVGVESYSCFLGWEPLKYFKLPILLGLTLDTSRIDEGRWLQETTVTKVPGITCLHRKVVSSPPCLASLLLPFHFPFLIDFIAPHSRYMLCHLDLQIQSQTMRLPDYVVSRGTLILWTVSLTRCMLWHWDSSQGAMSRSDLSDVRFSLNAGCAIRIYVIDFSRVDMTSLRRW